MDEPHSLHIDGLKITSANDSVRPKYYRIRGLECIDVIEALGLNFNLGSALKYVWRHDQKGGTEDLKKAEWYIGREIERREREGSDSGTDSVTP